MTINLAFNYTYYIASSFMFNERKVKKFKLHKRKYFQDESTSTTIDNLDHSLSTSHRQLIVILLRSLERFPNKM